MGVVGGRSKREGIHVCLHACFRSSHVWLSMTLWTVAHQGSIHGILHARILEWVAVPSSRGSSRPGDWNHVSYVSCVGRGFYHQHHLGNPDVCMKWKGKVAQSCPTLCDPMDQAPPSMEFSRQEYSSGLPFPPPGDLPDPGIELGLPHCRQMLYRLSHQG